jgi:hypothetical protein
MATQFYRTLDDIVKLKQENQQRLNDRVIEINETTNDSSYDDELAALKSNLKTIGVDNQSNGSIEDKWIDRSRRQEFIREHNIKQGTPRWFRVMYAQPDLTGEDPFGE